MTNDTSNKQTFSSLYFSGEAVDSRAEEGNEKMNEDYSVTLKIAGGGGEWGTKGDKMTRKRLIKTATAGAGIDTAPRRALASHR